jgi:hypothetical protein
MRGMALMAASVVGSLVLAGCGGNTKTVTEHEAAPSEPGVAATTTSVPKRVKSEHLNNPAQLPDPGVTAHCNEVRLGHACHAVTAAPEDPNVSPQRNCDTNIVANSHTSCGLAENAFYEYYEAHAAGSKGISVMVHSPTTGKDYELGCERSDRLVGCISSPTSDYIFVDFPEAAIAAYTEAQAKAYAASRDVGHPPAPYTPPKPAPSEGSGPPSGGESAGEDEIGSYSHASDEAFCREHECIGDFEGEDGYVVECEDGSYSHAGGKSGACSDHGGILRR